MTAMDISFKYSIDQKLRSVSGLTYHVLRRGFDVDRNEQFYVLKYYYFGGYQEISLPKDVIESIYNIQTD